MYTAWTYKKQQEKWYDLCYYQMHRAGNTHEDKCRGCIDDTKHTNYLSEDCVGCPYLDLLL